MFNRVIPTILLRHGGVVKGQRFRNHKYVGDPINIIKIFNDKEVDELIILDIAATRSGVGPDFDLIQSFASECFMPLCYGGGITTLEQARQLFSVGVEKISLQSSAKKNPALITEIAQEFGSQSVIISVDITRNIFGKYKVYHAANQSTISQNWLEYITKCVRLGAGELMITSVQMEGLLDGLDLSLIKTATDRVPVPIIAGGGVSSIEDIKLAVRNGASAVSVGSFFVFHGPHRAVLVTVPKREKIELALGKL